MSEYFHEKEENHIYSLIPIPLNSETYYFHIMMNFKQEQEMNA